MTMNDTERRFGMAGIVLMFTALVLGVVTVFGSLLGVGSDIWLCTGCFGLLSLVGVACAYALMVQAGIE